MAFDRDAFSQFAHVLIDSYFVVDLERNIVDYNQAFRAMFPRQVARSLKSKKCYEVLQLNICKDRCIAKQCWKAQQHVRFDEIGGRIAGDEGKEMRFILSAIPIRDENNEIIGALEVQRNVTDEAVVQQKYQQQVDASAEELRRVTDLLHQRTKQLMRTSRLLSEARRALLRAKTDLFG